MTKKKKTIEILRNIEATGNQVQRFAATWRGGNYPIRRLLG